MLALPVAGVLITSFPLMWAIDTTATQIKECEVRIKNPLIRTGLTVVLGATTPIFASGVFVYENYIADETFDGVPCK